MKIDRILPKNHSRMSRCGSDFWNVLTVIGMIIEALLRLVRQANDDMWERRD